ncbi:superoxide dismutase family protein Rsod [Arctopsyche grandis]|uniref:superoxide dismutase family protein Rsod n=1 Tax=Arctopsyche grandis TaxID=121162 RepID=UPI00406DA113
MFIKKITILVISLCVLLSNSIVNCVVLRAFVSQYGLHGEIEFSFKGENHISIRTNLKTTLEFPDQVWQWGVREFPVDYSEIDIKRCSDADLGKEIIDLTSELGYLTLPGNESTEYISENNLIGDKGLWGKSLVLKSPENSNTICANIVSNDRTVERVAVAKFNSPVAGFIYFRWIASKEFDHTDIYVHTDLYHVKNSSKKVPFTQHNWKVFVTDIFDSGNDKSEENCNILQLVFDPENKGDGKGVGDIDSRLGKVKISTDPAKEKVKTLYKDDGLTLLPSDLGGPHRNLYIVIFEEKHGDSFLSCAKIRHHHARYSKALIDSDGIRGEIEFKQQSKFDPTWITFNLSASDGTYESSLKYASSVLTYEIAELPRPPASTHNKSPNNCDIGNIYNPKNVDLKFNPPPGMGTQDQYPLGDLFGKLKGRTEYLNHKYLLPSLSNELSGTYWDAFLPLQGPNSVIHRSLVIKRYENKSSLCSTIALYDQDTKYQTQMYTAQVILRYPLVGRVILRQPKDEPWVDTSILFEYLVHADGSNLNNSFQHRWAIHESAPNQDFYNWTARCLSAANVYNPFKVDFDPKATENSCSFSNLAVCRVGDLSTRHGTLGISGKKVDAPKISRKLITDPLIPLSGTHSVLGKSLVIYDDHGPVARGERLACSIIGGLYRRKAVIKDWYSNGEPLQMSGKLEFLQQTEYDITNLEVNLDGLNSVGDYRIHLTPVEGELEFPCESSTLYGTFNPLHIDEKKSPEPAIGTNDQYGMGDLSGKFGSLQNHTKYLGYFNDSQISLFGPRSILGRSVVIQKESKHQRWACSSIERGYSPSEARELRAIASFHHPAGFAYGYVRMTQLIHKDGSQSDTIIEVKLRHPGVRDRNITRYHNWAIFVNPVGVDATVSTTATRCVAGGYRWNPYFTQLADPLNEDLYNQECGADNPLRCHIGDLTARLGTIDIGLDRQVFTDSNFPLEGVVTALGRSIVIMGQNRSSERFACANIEPDNDIVKYANIRKPPRFVVSQFIEDVRHVMGLPEWMLTVDSRKTKTLHQNSCIQFLLHFKGPRANQLEKDFTKLLTTGKLDEPSISIPGFVNQKRKKSISYRQCGVRDPNEKTKTRSYIFSSSSGYLLKGTPILILMSFVLLNS